MRANLGYLYGLAVAKDWRRRGIGHALTQERLDWLASKSIKSVYVLAMFWNIRFFKKHGFVLVDRKIFSDLSHLHEDFSDRWSRRSALLRCDLRLH